MRKKFFSIFFLSALAAFFGYRQVRASLWDGKSHLNLVLISSAVEAKNALVISLEPEKSLNILVLPDNLYLEVPYGYGQYQLGSIYPLGELEGQAGKLMKATIQQSLAIPVEAYLKLSRNCSGQEPAGCCLEALKGRGETDLSRWDLFRLWLKIKQLRQDEASRVNLIETSILKELELPDGTVVLKTESTLMDNLVKKFFSDRRVRDEALKIEILNATKYVGVANEVARLLDNIGGVVIGINNAEVKSQKSKIKSQDEKIKNSYTVKKLEKILGIEAETGEMGDSRADLLIILGEDYYQRWHH